MMTTDDRPTIIVGFEGPGATEPTAYTCHAEGWRCERAEGESVEALRARAQATVPANPRGVRILFECQIGD
jgi:hypothetical protein